MWIKLTKSWMGRPRRTVMNIKEGQALLMIDRGAAEPCLPPKKDDGRKTMKDKMKDTMVKEAPVQKAV